MIRGRQRRSRAAMSADAEAIRLAEVDEQVDQEARAKFYEKLYDLSASTVDRSRAAAEVVQKSAAAIVTVYSGILAVVFTVTGNPFPLRGLLTPTFIGISIACSAAYSGFVGSGDKFTFVAPLDRSLVSQRELRGFIRYSLFSDIATNLSMRRIWLLHTSVAALAVGVIFIVAPFIDLRPEGNPDGARSLEAGRNLSAGPSPPPSAASNETGRILYQKQVEEVAEVRKKELRRSANRNDAGVTIGLGVAGLLLVTAVGAISGTRYAMRRNSQQKTEKD